MVEATLGAPARRIGRSLQLSAWLAPIEPGALNARMAFWTYWPVNKSEEAVAAKHQDVLAVATWVAPNDAAALLNGLPGEDEPIVAAAFEQLSAERRTLLKGAGLEAGSIKVP
jgi:hypothetical protein